MHGNQAHSAAVSCLWSHHFPAATAAVTQGWRSWRSTAVSRMAHSSGSYTRHALTAVLCTEANWPANTAVWKEVFKHPFPANLLIEKIRPPRHVFGLKSKSIKKGALAEAIAAAVFSKKKRLVIRTLRAAAATARIYACMRVLVYTMQR